MSSGVPVNVEARNFEGQQIWGRQGRVPGFGVGVILGESLFGWDWGEFSWWVPNWGGRGSQGFLIWGI